MTTTLLNTIAFTLLLLLIHAQSSKTKLRQISNSNFQQKSDKAGSLLDNIGSDLQILQDNQDNLLIYQQEQDKNVDTTLFKFSKDSSDFIIQTQIRQSSTQNPPQLKAQKKDQTISLQSSSNIINLDDLLRQADVQKTQQNNSDNSVEDADEELLIEYALVATLIFLLLHILRFWLQKKLDEYLGQACSSLFTDITLMSFVLSVSIILNYEDIFTDWNVDWKAFHFGFALFLIFWLVIGAYLLLASQAVGRQWQIWEYASIDLKKLCRDFENLYHQVKFREGGEERSNRLEKQQYYQKKQNLVYATLRQGFISPQFTPAFSENFLRDDFDFASYLCQCLGQLIGQIFKMEWVTYIFMIILAAIWYMLRQMDKKTQVIIVVLFPFVMLLFAVLVKHKLNWIFKQLVDQDTIDEVRLSSSIVRNPFDQIDKIPEPPYLQPNLINIENPQQKINVFNARDCTYAYEEAIPLNKTWSRFLRGQVPNRHEALFWLDAYGPQMMVQFAQIQAVIGCLWITVMIAIHIPDIYGEMNDMIGTFLIMMSIFVWLIVVGYFTPDIIRLLTLTSKTEQLKDKEIINKVIALKRLENSARSIKIYRRIKQIRKEMAAEDTRNKMISKPILKKIKDYFQIFDYEGKDVIEAEKLENLGRLAGFDLSEDELRILEKNCNINGKVEFKKLVHTIESMFHDVHLDPAIVTTNVLTIYFSAHYQQETKFITLQDLKVFMQEHCSELGEQEIIDFLHEVKYLQDQKDQIKISEIGSLIRNDIELLPH